MDLYFTPTFEKHEVELRLGRLLVPGSLLDASLERRLVRLADAFRQYAACYPLPLWAPGLVIDNEMRGLTEALFPMTPVRALFDLVLRRGCRFAPMVGGSYLHSSASWVDFLNRFRPRIACADPAATLRRIAMDYERRRTFLFALLLPHHFGGGFDRYPSQSQWVEGWLRENLGRSRVRIRLLDSACGSGEGTYGVAETARRAGVGGDCTVHGSTLEPVELFAAAHAFFPHDPEREMEYRRRIAPLLERGAGVSMEFYLDEIGSESRREPYHLVLCNGLLGGPLMHDPGELMSGIAALASRLMPGGVLLAADRFHAGWRQMVPAEMLEEMMRQHGLEPFKVLEGVAARKPL
jgi:hypothetical protein